LIADFERRILGDVSAELRADLGHVVGEKWGLVTGAGDGDVAETGVEKVRVDRRRISGRSEAESLYRVLPPLPERRLKRGRLIKEEI